ncbi:MAG: Ldh family oxidoreductase [Bryobacterales bacterium]
MGQVAAAFAMQSGPPSGGKRRRAGAVRGSNHCGALAYYVRMAANQGFIGVASTNALPTMAP